ncbi:MAG TPA: ABC transporter, partial [Pedobacter sp.]
VRMMPGNLVEPTSFEMPQMIRPYITATGANLADEGQLLKFRESLKEKGNTDSLKVMMSGATALSYNTNGPFTIKPLLMTVGKNTWLKQGVLVTDSAQIIYNPNKGDVKGSFPTALQLTRQISNKQQRIVVLSDADILSNTRGGGDFLGIALYSWLDYNKFPIYTSKAKAKDNKLLIGPGTANILTIFYVWILPTLVLIFGTVLLIRRKRK